MDEKECIIPENKFDALKYDYPISVPDLGSGGKTNEWRLERPIIDNEKCIKCLICWIDCPEGTITRKDDDTVEVNYEYCKGCGICANECPTKAIKMQKEE